MKLVKYFTLSVFAMFLVSCTGRQGGTLTGAIRIDGSSTVYPITEAIAEEYRLEQPRVRITIGVSGTGGGFQKFTRGEIDINNASRPIKDPRSEEHTSELQSRENLVCRLLLEKKKHETPTFYSLGEIVGASDQPVCVVGVYCYCPLAIRCEQNLIDPSASL